MTFWKRNSYRERRLVRDKTGEKKQAGVVAWKDRKMVYCMTNDTAIGPMDQCRRHSAGGLIYVPRPQVVTKY
jgi:hypothetical protein